MSYLDYLSEAPQLDMFEAPPISEPLAEGAKYRDYLLRWYQQEAKDAIELELAVNQSTLLVLATGLGKTETACAVIGDWEGDCLVLAPRDELVTQARERLERLLGEPVDTEQRELKSGREARIVVGSVQSMNKRRLERLGKDRFSLVVADEGHRFLAPTFRRAFEFFDCKRLGLTATPDRGDEKAMGKIFDSVAYIMDIAHGIEAGYLVPLEARTVQLQEIDISGIDTVAGDLVAAQLDEVMVKAVEGIVKKTIELEPGRQGIGFFPGVKSAELAAARMNHYRPGSSAWVSGDTPVEERRDIMRRFKAREIQYLFNVLVAIEGFDAPSCDMVIWGRPTKSRGFYAQGSGRCTRVLPGTVDSVPEKHRAAERRALIGLSAKPNAMILDFVGNTGKHKLVTPEDLLGGSYTDAEVKLAKKKRAESGGDPLAALEAARAELRKIAAAITASVKAQVSEKFNPFTAFGINRAAMEESAIRFGWKPISTAQRDLLVQKGMDMEEASQLSRSMATKLIGTIMVRQNKGLASFKQLRELARRGYSVPKNISFKRASELLAT